MGLQAFVSRRVATLGVLPGLVDSHVHINDPGRTEWEGFETATRAAASGGYTMLVDMPLNCLPATTTVAALAAKREAAKERCWVDWGSWGGVVHNNQSDVEALAAAGVRGFKCFLIHPGIDGFTMVTEPELRAALPHVARTGLPLLVASARCGLEPLRDLPAIAARGSGARGSSVTSIFVQAVQVPIAHCSSLSQPGAFRVVRGPGGGASGKC